MKPAKAQGEACSCVVHILDKIRGRVPLLQQRKLTLIKTNSKTTSTGITMTTKKWHPAQMLKPSVSSVTRASWTCDVLKFMMPGCTLRPELTSTCASPGCCPSACGCPPPETCEAASEGATLGATDGEVTLHVVAPEAQRHLPWLLVDPGPWTLLDLGPSTFLDLGPWALDQIPVR